MAPSGGSPIVEITSIPSKPTTTVEETSALGLLLAASRGPGRLPRPLESHPPPVGDQTSLHQYNATTRTCFSLEQIVVDQGPLSRPESGPLRSDPTHTLSEVPGGASCKCST